MLNIDYEDNNLRKVKETLLKLTPQEKRERLEALSDYLFYRGKSIDLEAAKENPILLGQNWEVKDNVDYKPTQEITNKVKPILKKQARWMFGKEPTIVIKADDLKDKEDCENLRKFLDDVFEDNNFWNNTRKAFLEATIRKRVLLRVEANPGMPILIKYETIDNFFYKEKNNKLISAHFFEEDEKNAYVDKEDEKIYYIHTYYYKLIENKDKTKELQAWYKKETYFNTKLQEELTVDQDTGFSKIPCWLIKNGGELNSKYGESDVEELRDKQNSYNKTKSDMRDALKFGMFGAESIIDGNPEDVKNFKVAPNAVHAVRTRDELLESGKQASIQRLEYTMSNSSAVDSFLARTEDDMLQSMDIPRISDLSQIPSGKALGYLYNDLIARCDEKFNDWEGPLKELINFILEVGSTCYPGIFNTKWLAMMYTLLIKRNVPLPSDEDDKKDKAMDEVKNNVRSHKSYIKEFSDEEDAEKAFQEILDEQQQISDSQADSYTKQLNDELNNDDQNLEDNNGEGGTEENE